MIIGHADRAIGLDPHNFWAYNEKSMYLNMFGPIERGVQDSRPGYREQSELRNVVQCASFRRNQSR